MSRTAVEHFQIKHPTYVNRCSMLLVRCVSFMPAAGLLLANYPLKLPMDVFDNRLCAVSVGSGERSKHDETRLAPVYGDWYCATEIVNSNRDQWL